MNYIHLLELSLIRNLQLLRTSWLDNFFLFLNYFDTFYFPLILIPIIWIGYYWKWGVKVLSLITCSSMLNEMAKLLFHQPRPYFLDPSVGLIHLKNFGFPSGGALSTIIYSGLMILYFKNKKVAWILSLNLIFWISLSRIYLGVHFISDIIGGYLLGLILIYLFYKFQARIEKYLSTQSPGKICLINSFFCLILFTVNIYYIRVIAISFFLVVIGLIFSKRFNLLMNPSSSYKEGLLKVIVYFVGAFFLIWILIGFSSCVSIKTLGFIGSGVLSLWLGFFINFIWKKLFINVKFKS